MLYDGCVWDYYAEQGIPSSVTCNVKININGHYYAHKISEIDFSIFI